MTEAKRVRFDWPKTPENFDVTNYEKDPDGAWVELEYQNEGNRDAIDDKVNPTRFIYNPDGEAAIPQMEIRKAMKRAEIADVYIKDWYAFNDANGNAMKCTSKNKRKYSYEKGFANALQQFIEKMNEDVEKEKEKERKN